MTNRRMIRLSLIAICLPALALPLAAQVNGRLTGVVIDATGAVIPSVNVALRYPGGTSAIVSTVTGVDGSFALLSLLPQTYELVLEAAGFQPRTLIDLKIDPGRQLDLPPIRLEVATAAQSVEVTAAAPGAQTGSVEISTTVTLEQVMELPGNNRDPMWFLSTQPGVTKIMPGRTPTINGQRASFVNLTLDGINIQDPYGRSASLVMGTNNLTGSQVAEVTIATSNSNSSAGGGSLQVGYVTPSATNRYRGNLFYANRNSFFAANDWFANRAGTPKGRNNTTQFGGLFGGPVKRDRLFFVASFEAYRAVQQSNKNLRVFTADGRQGIFTYRDTAGAVRKVNILSAMGMSIDPTMAKIIAEVPGPEKINNYLTGDSTESFLRNTAGYSFLGRNNRSRDNVTGKLEYVPSSRHSITGTYAWNREDFDLNITPDFGVAPKSQRSQGARLMSLGWRWSPLPRLTNEVRGGFNRIPYQDTNQDAGVPYYLTLPAVFPSNPINNTVETGRTAMTWNLSDTAGLITGKHTFQFGATMQTSRVEIWSNSGIVPTYTLGVGTGGNRGLAAAQLPGATSADLNNANTMLAGLVGYIQSASQTFNVTSPTSGYVAGAPNTRHLELTNYALFAQDAWKMTRRLTLNLGLRWEYYTPVNERDSLFALPVLQGNDPVKTLLSNGTVDFAGKSVGRPVHRDDKNNFAPNIGIAWDPFGRGRTSVRAGYSINFVNDEAIYSMDSMVGTVANQSSRNIGLSSTLSRSGLAGTIGAGLPVIGMPVYKMPHTYQEAYSSTTNSSLALPDPMLRVPYVQQWSFGVQQEWKKIVFEVRYMGNHATKQVRAFDLNQVDVISNGFLADFQRAQSNGNLARAATGIFNANYNANIPGSQRLTMFPLLPNGGNLSNATILNFIDTGQAAGLAANYVTTNAAGPFTFNPIPYARFLEYLSNYSNSNYNALQIDVRRRVAKGVRFQANYVLSKALSDSPGTNQTRIEDFLDTRNPNIERQPVAYDLKHVIKGNGLWELPLGPGHFLDVPLIGRLIAGWNLSGTYIWHTGLPFSVLSGRQTLTNRGTNPAVTLLTGDQLKDYFKFRMTSVGPYFVEPAALYTTGTGVSPPGVAPFAGQVFFHPVAGTLGSLQKGFFRGPGASELDMKLSKVTKLSERHSVELRVDAVNVLNHPTFYLGDQSLDSTSFGRITGGYYARRQLQFTATIRF